RPGFWTLGIADKRIWVWIALALALVAYLFQLYLDRSRRGYQLAAVREDEEAALSLGVPARWLKVAAICVSAALTAACGALWAQYIGFVDPFYVFSVDLSVKFALAAIIGGLGTALGPFLGAALVTTVETYLRAQFGGIGAGLVGIYLIVYGCALIVMVRWVPHGLVGWIGERWRGRGAAGAASRASCRSPASPSASAASSPIAGSRSTSSRASWWVSSGRTAPANRPCSRSSRASTIRTRSRCGWTGRDSPACRPTSCAGAEWPALSRSCDRFRGSPSSTTSWSVP